MRIILNGQSTSVQDNLTLQGLLQSMKIQPQLVACELNLKIVKRGSYADTMITEGDSIEVLQMIGGG